MKIQSIQSLCRAAGLTLVGSLTLAAVSTVSQSEKAAAVDLSFSTTTQTAVNRNPFNFGFGPGVGNIGTVNNSNNPVGSTAPVLVNYTNVAPGIDARITATTFGAGYSFVEHIPNYSAVSAGEPAGDSAFLYQKAANQTGLGGMTYKIDLFNSGSNFTVAAAPVSLRFLAYDVDGEAPQGEAVRIFKNNGFAGYQVGNTANALIPTEETNSYLFSGRDVNRPENDPSGAAIFYFENTNSVTFQFEADTRTAGTNNNPVFSAIDGDLSLLAGDLSGFASRVNTSATAVPEPFTVIGTLIGGTAAFRMRKKLKANSGV